MWGQPWCWTGGGRVSGTPGDTSEDSSILALGSMFPGHGKGEVPGTCKAFVAKKPLGAQPWLCTHCGECSTFKALSNISQDIGTGGGQLIPHGHHIATGLCSWCRVAWQPGLWAQRRPGPWAQRRPGPAWRPCQGPVAGQRWGCGETQSAFHPVSTNCITSAPCASNCAVCLSLEDTLPSASK